MFKYHTQIGPNDLGFSAFVFYLLQFDLVNILLAGEKYFLYFKIFSPLQTDSAEVDNAGQGSQHLQVADHFADWSRLVDLRVYLDNLMMCIILSYIMMRKYYLATGLHLCELKYLQVCGCGEGHSIWMIGKTEINLFINVFFYFNIIYDCFQSLSCKWLQNGKTPSHGL